MASRKEEILSRLRNTLAIVSQAKFEPGEISSLGGASRTPESSTARQTARDPRLGARYTSVQGHQVSPAAGLSGIQSAEQIQSSSSGELYGQSWNVKKQPGSKQHSTFSTANLGNIDDVDDEDEFLYGNSRSSKEPVHSSTANVMLDYLPDKSPERDISPMYATSKSYLQQAVSSASEKAGKFPDVSSDILQNVLRMVSKQSPKTNVEEKPRWVDPATTHTSQSRTVPGQFGMTSHVRNPLQHASREEEIAGNAYGQPQSAASLQSSGFWASLKTAAASAHGEPSFQGQNVVPSIQRPVRATAQMSDESRELGSTVDRILQTMNIDSDLRRLMEEKFKKEDEKAAKEEQEKKRQEMERLRLEELAKKEAEEREKRLKEEQNRLFAEKLIQGILKMRGDNREAVARENALLEAFSKNTGESLEEKTKILLQSVLSGHSLTEGGRFLPQAMPAAEEAAVSLQTALPSVQLPAASQSLQLPTGLQSVQLPTSLVSVPPPTASQSVPFPTALLSGPPPTASQSVPFPTAALMSVPPPAVSQSVPFPTAALMSVPPPTVSQSVPFPTASQSVPLPTGLPSVEPEKPDKSESRLIITSGTLLKSNLELTRDISKPRSNIDPAWEQSIEEFLGRLKTNKETKVEDKQGRNAPDQATSSRQSRERQRGAGDDGRLGKKEENMDSEGIGSRRSVPKVVDSKSNQPGSEQMGSTHSNRVSTEKEIPMVATTLHDRSRDEMRADIETLKAELVSLQKLNSGSSNKAPSTSNQPDAEVAPAVSTEQLPASSSVGLASHAAVKKSKFTSSQLQEVESSRKEMSTNIGALQLELENLQRLSSGLTLRPASMQRDLMLEESKRMQSEIEDQLWALRTALTELTEQFFPEEKEQENASQAIKTTTSSLPPVVSKSSVEANVVALGHMQSASNVAAASNTVSSTRMKESSPFVEEKQVFQKQPAFESVIEQKVEKPGKAATDVKNAGKSKSSTRKKSSSGSRSRSSSSSSSTSSSGSGSSSSSSTNSRSRSRSRGRSREKNNSKETKSKYATENDMKRRRKSRSQDRSGSRERSRSGNRSRSRDRSGKNRKDSSSRHRSRSHDRPMSKWTNYRGRGGRYNFGYRGRTRNTGYRFNRSRSRSLDRSRSGRSEKRKSPTTRKMKKSRSRSRSASEKGSRDLKMNVQIGDSRAAELPSSKQTDNIGPNAIVTSVSAEAKYDPMAGRPVAAEGNKNVLPQKPQELHNTADTKTAGCSVDVSDVEKMLDEKRKRALELAVNMYMKAEEYYDGGNIWCRKCNLVFVDIMSLCQHLHSDQHQLVIDPNYCKPKVSDVPKLPAQTGVPSAPARGDEFLMPLQAFFCSLCCEFSKDNVHAEAHLKGAAHNNRFKQFLKENPSYEIQYLMGKMSALLQSKQAKEVKTTDEPLKRPLPEALPEHEVKRIKITSLAQDARSASELNNPEEIKFKVMSGSLGLINMPSAPKPEEKRIVLVNKKPNTLFRNPSPPSSVQSSRGFSQTSFEEQAFSRVPHAITNKQGTTELGKGGVKLQESASFDMWGSPGVAKRRESRSPSSSKFETKNPVGTKNVNESRTVPFTASGLRFQLSKEKRTVMGRDQPKMQNILMGKKDDDRQSAGSTKSGASKPFQGSSKTSFNVDDFEVFDECD